MTAPRTGPLPETTHPATVDDVAARLRLSATRLARLLRQQSDTGLTPTQGAALATIERQGPLPVGTLAEIEQVSAPTATKVVAKLEARGLVERHADPSDRRVSLVALTADGRELLRTVRAQKTAWLATRLASLSAEDLRVLTDALDVLDHLTAPPTTSPARSPAAAPPGAGAAPNRGRSA